MSNLAIGIRMQFFFLFFHSAGASGFAAMSPLIAGGSCFLSANKRRAFRSRLILVSRPNAFSILPLSSSGCGGLLPTTSGGGIGAGASGCGGICCGNGAPAY